jgi:photosystem II stability/assembly factor-like uncharacterized protein
LKIQIKVHVQVLFFKMTFVLAAMENSVLILESSKSGWKTTENLKGSRPQAVALDQGNSERLYCGTFDRGLMTSDNGGKSWYRIGKGSIPSSSITSVSVDHDRNRKNEFSKVYAGTEPSALYASNDGGDSWEKMSGLNDLHSSDSWSFPPRPWTNHVRWIEIDANDPNRIFVAIEAGALVQTFDGGKNWTDRVKGSPYDTHTLRTHLKAPKRLHVAAGDGYFESFDYGKSWGSPREGLEHDYLVSLALDSANPLSVILSASASAMQAHARGGEANSVMYRKSIDSEKWHKISNGLPEPKGTIVTMLSSNPIKGGEFYGINNRGIFCSNDSGASWVSLEIEWPKEYLQQHPFGIVIGND